MASGTQMDLDWAATDATADGAHGGADVVPTSAPNAAADARYLTDEEILGLEPVHGGTSAITAVIPSEARLPDGQAKNLSSGFGKPEESRQRDSSSKFGPRNDNASEETERATLRPSQADSGQASHESHGGVAMPQWIQAAAADPQHGAEAQQLWREHQEFRAAFASPEEARAIKELLPGGVRDVLSLREATQSVERIDAALFSGDARAQSEVVAELARVNPAAFRSLFAEAAKVLAVLGAGGRGKPSFDGSAANDLDAGPTLRQTREGWGTRNSEAAGWRSEVGNPDAALRAPMGPRITDRGQRETAPASSATNHDSRSAEQGSRVASHQSPVTSHAFDPAAYAAFERSTNDAVARDVRGSISDSLARVLPEGVADGAARRIGEDIFQEIHRALASDRTLSEQVAAVLRERQFGSAEQQQVSSLLAGRARQLVPSVARRVIGEWTSSVLNTSRSKAARQAAAASRVDIAAPGGSLDSMPLRPSATAASRGVDYTSMTDEQILGI